MDDFAEDLRKHGGNVPEGMDTAPMVPRLPNFTNQMIPGGVAGPTYPDAPPAAVPGAGVHVGMPSPQGAATDAAVMQPNGSGAFGAEPLAGLAPKGPAVEADEDADLRAAQANAQREGDQSHLGAILNRATGLIIGRPNLGGDEIYARGEANAGKGIRDLMQRRDSAQKKVQEAEKKALFDPNSAISKRATMLAQSQGLIKPGQTISAAEWNDIRQGAGVQAQKDQAAASLAQTAEQAKAQRGYEYAALKSHAQDSAENRNLQREIHASDKAADLQRALAEAEAKKKDGSQPGSLVAPGFERGTIPVKDEELGKFRASVAAREQVMKSKDQLKALYDKHGGQMTGPVRAQYEALDSNIKLQLKNLNQLGALSGSDLDLMQDQVPALGGMSGYLTSTKTADSKLDQLGASLDNTVNSQASSLGLRSHAPASQSKAPPHGPTVVQNGHTFTWNPQSESYE